MRVDRTALAAMELGGFFGVAKLSIMDYELVRKDMDRAAQDAGVKVEFPDSKQEFLDNQVKLLTELIDQLSDQRSQLGGSVYSLPMFMLQLALGDALAAICFEHELGAEKRIIEASLNDIGLSESEFDRLYGLSRQVEKVEDNLDFKSLIEARKQFTHVIIDLLAQVTPLADKPESKPVVMTMSQLREIVDESRDKTSESNLVTKLQENIDAFVKLSRTRPIVAILVLIGLVAAGIYAVAALFDL